MGGGRSNKSVKTAGSKDPFQQNIDRIQKFFPGSEGVNSDKATGIPYYFSQVGDLLQNNSTVSISTFQRMLYTDDRINICYKTQLVNVVGRIGPFEHPNEEIQEAVRLMLKKLEGGLPRLAKWMYSKKWAGFFIGQVVWRKPTFDDLELRPSKVVPMPPSTVQFRVNPAGEVQKGRGKKGVLQYQFNFLPGGVNMYSYWGVGYPNVVNSFNSSATVSGNNEALGWFNDPLAANGDADFPIRSYVVPPFVPVAMKYETFIHIVNDIGDAFISPVGRSDFRYLYDLYVKKYAIWQLYLIALERRSTPMIALYADSQRTLTDSLGQQWNPVDIGMAIAPQITSLSCVVLPGLKQQLFELEAIKSDGDLNIFKDTIDLINTQIEIAMLGAPLLSGTGSYAQSTSQGGFFDRLVRDEFEQITYALIMQLVKPYIEENFNENEHSFEFGKFGYKALSSKEQLEFAKTAEVLKGSNFISDQELGDLNRVREMTEYEKVEKAFDPLIEELPGSESRGTNVRGARDHYKHEPMEDQ